MGSEGVEHYRCVVRMGLGGVKHYRCVVRMGLGRGRQLSLCSKNGVGAGSQVKNNPVYFNKRMSKGQASEEQSCGGV